jgi:hypothetical protein
MKKMKKKDASVTKDADALYAAMGAGIPWAAAFTEIADGRLLLEMADVNGMPQESAEPEYGILGPES